MQLPWSKLSMYIVAHCLGTVLGLYDICYYQNQTESCTVGDFNPGAADSGGGGGAGGAAAPPSKIMEGQNYLFAPPPPPSSKSYLCMPCVVVQYIFMYHWP